MTTFLPPKLNPEYVTAMTLSSIDSEVPDLIASSSSRFQLLFVRTKEYLKHLLFADLYVASVFQVATVRTSRIIDDFS